MRRWALALGVLAAGGCDEPRRPADPLQECVSLCTVNMGVCNQGCQSDAQCNRLCAITNDKCLDTCNRTHGAGSRAAPAVSR